MKLEVNLDNNWVNDYEDTIAKLIQFEIDATIRAEVKKTISQHDQKKGGICNNVQKHFP